MPVSSVWSVDCFISGKIYRNSVFLKLSCKIVLENSQPIGMEPISDFSKVSLHKDNVMIPQERLRSTPSSEDGCPEDLEMDLRIAGCDQILKAGLMLELPQVAMSTAQVLFHRFFYARSFVKHSLLVSWSAPECITK